MRPALSDAPEILFLAGPPVGAACFRQVIARLGQGRSIDVTDAAAPTDGWSERAEVIADSLRRRPTILVAHGLAVPAAIGAALRAPPRALVLSNGPVTRLDPITAALGRLASLPGGARVVAQGVLRPALWIPWLASSAGLRRAVVNPYVMDRDTVATLCEPLVASSAGRRSVASYLASLWRGLPDARSIVCPTMLAWGDEDALYPACEACVLEASLPIVKHVAVPGGRFLHPEERPWELADHLRALLEEGPRGERP